MTGNCIASSLFRRSHKLEVLDHAPEPVQRRLIDRPTSHSRQAKSANERTTTTKYQTNWAKFVFEPNHSHIFNERACVARFDRSASDTSCLEKNNMTHVGDIKG